MRAVVLITGASRGFGRCLALDFTRELQCQDVDLVRACVLGWLGHWRCCIDVDMVELLL